MVDEVKLRHELHQTPELATREFETQRILYDAFVQLGIRPLKVAGTGLILVLESVASKPSVLYRADMDALPIVEETGWEFASKNSNMHACGHDVHMAVLYGVVKRIVERQVTGNFVFVLQPAEETIGGAKFVLQEMRERFKVRCATALHVTDEFELGEFASTAGTLFASAMEVFVRFSGRAAHIAEKHRGDDALMKASHFLHDYYGFFRDVFEPGSRVLSGFGKMRAGNVRNQVADYAELEGSIRGEELGIVLRKFQELRELASKHGGVVERGSLYPPVVNDSGLLDLFVSYVMDSGYKFVDCGMKFTGEDFGFFSLKYPSFMFWAGVRSGEERVGLHNPRFLPDDEAVPFLSEFMFGWLMKLWHSM